MVAWPKVKTQVWPIEPDIFTFEEMSLAMQKLFWIDLEMTGLNVENEVIIEVGAVITDLKMNSLENYHAVVKQPPFYIQKMDEWNTKHHGESGLTAQIPNGRDPHLVEEDLLALVKRHFPNPKERPILAGNSIAQDRLFIDKYFPKLAASLHYRMLDVSSFKVVFNNIYNKKYEKKNAHRAVDDILESINELKFYQEFIKV